MVESSNPFEVSVQLEDGSTKDVGWSEIEHIVIHKKSYFLPLAWVYGSALVLGIIAFAVIGISLSGWDGFKLS